MQYKSYEYREGKIKLTKMESLIMDILMNFGKSIDPQGYDGGDYDKAMSEILKLVNHKDD